MVHEAFLASPEPREVVLDHGPSDLFKSFFRRLFYPDKQSIVWHGAHEPR